MMCIACDLSSPCLFLFLPPPRDFHLVLQFGEALGAAHLGLGLVVVADLVAVRPALVVAGGAVGLAVELLVVDAFLHASLELLVLLALAVADRELVAVLVALGPVPLVLAALALALAVLPLVAPGRARALAAELAIEGTIVEVVGKFIVGVQRRSYRDERKEEQDDGEDGERELHVWLFGWVVGVSCNSFRLVYRMLA